MMLFVNASSVESYIGIFTLVYIYRKHTLIVDSCIHLLIRGDDDDINNVKEIIGDRHHCPPQQADVIIATDVII